MDKLNRWATVSICLLATASTLPAHAQQSNEELARAAQNPLASLISVLLQRTE